MKSSKQIIFELNKEPSLDKAVEILEAHEKEVAIKFAGYYKTKIFRLGDSPATGDYLRSELFDEWQKQNSTILYPKTDEDAFKPRTNGLRPLDEHFPKNQEEKQ